MDTIDQSDSIFTLDRLYFENGNVVLSGASLAQLNNIASVLRNFPSTVVQIHGHTDNTGDSLNNEQLSLQRAISVSNELTRLGVGKNQIGKTRGYGGRSPVCPPDGTPECRARNRRIELQVSAR
jgi:K(+)-stimulated pyrophosphate-energized sodium pump